MKGPIRPIERSRVVRRDDSRLASAWVCNGSDDAKPSHVTVLGAPGEPPQGNDVVLAMVAPGDTLATKEVIAHAASGRRVYAIVPATWGNERLERGLLEAPHVLIRRVPEVPVSGVHAGDRGRLWFGAKAGGPVSWCLWLDGPQSTAFRTIFLRLFWYEGFEEAWTGASQLAWRPAMARPFDVPVPATTAPVHLAGAEASLGRANDDVIQHVVVGPPPKDRVRRLWFPASGLHHNDLKNLVGSGTEVTWGSLNLPDVTASGLGGELLLPAHGARLRVVLTPGQGRQLHKALDGAATWRFGAAIRLGDVAATSSLWLPEEAGPRGLKPEEVIVLGAMSSSSLRSAPQLEPPSLPAPEPLTLSVDFRWTVLPPGCPSGSQDDSLVRQWRILDEQWRKRLVAARTQLASADQERVRLGEGFRRLAGAVLGFGRTHETLLQKLGMLEGQELLSMAPETAQAALDELVTLEGQARAFRDDLEAAERQAREDDERDQQMRAWETKQSEATAAVPRMQQELQVIKKALADLEAEKDQASSVEDENDQKARRAKLSDDIIRLERKKVADDIIRLERKKKELVSELKVQQAAAEGPFEFKPSRPLASAKSAGARFVPAVRAGPPDALVPRERLPTTGVLRSHLGSRYLVIDAWQELDEGEAEAARLGAQLVAKEGT